MKKGKTLPEESSLRQKAEAIIEKLNSRKARPQVAHSKQSSTEAEMQKLIHELEVHQIELELQNEELRQAKARAEFAAEQYADLYEEIYDFSPAGYFTITPEGTICELNYNGAGMFGKVRSDLVGSNFRLFISQATLPVFNDFLHKVFSTNSKQTCEVALSVLGEKDTFVHVEGMVSRDKLKCIVSVVDITALGQSEKALRVSEQGIRLKLEAILSPSGNPEVLELSDIIDAKAIQAIMDEFYSVTHIGVGLIDLNGKVLVANGWQDICTKFHRVHPEACRNCIESDTKLTLGGQLGSFNAYNCMNNMWDISTPIIVGGKHLGNIFLGQFLYDDEIPDYEVFRAQARKFGFDEEEYMDALDRVPRWSHETVKNVMSFYSRLSTLISNISYSNLKLAQTIEERNRAVEELKNNYSLLRIAGETAKFGGWSLDLIEKKVVWSDVVASIHETTPEYSPTVEEGINFYAPEYREQITRAVSDCAEEGISYDMELELITAKGNRVWVRTTGEAVRAKNGKIIKIQGSFQDITKRKQMENELAQEKTLIDAIFNSIPGMIYLYDLEGNLIRWNKKHELLTGYTTDELSQIKLVDWYKGDEESQKAISEGIETTLLKGYGTAEVRLQKKDGTTIPMYFTASPLTINGKKYFTGIGIDITLRKQAEAALKTSEEIFNQFLESSPIYIFFKDEKIRSLRLSRNFEEMLGKPLVELLGKSMYELFPSDFAKNMVEADLQILKKGEELTYEEEFNGRFYSTTKFPIQIEGKQNFLAGFTIDITEQRLAEQALKEREASLRELNSTKDKFFSIIAHDLKSPFNSIIGFSSLLTRQIQERDYAAIEKYAGIIQNSSQQALDLLINLLEWSRSQTGRMVFNPESIDIVDLINQSTELLNASAQQKSITIYSEMPVNLPVFADKAMISTILRNLISNAIKFTDTGGEIVISTEQLNTELVISVLDSGVGMNSESIGKLFRIDENFSTLGTQKEKGTGLGLLLCKEFIDKHGGRIWVESEPGKGSRFFFSVPKSVAANLSL